MTMPTETVVVDQWSDLLPDAHKPGVPDPACAGCWQPFQLGDDAVIVATPYGRRAYHRRCRVQ